MFNFNFSLEYIGQKMETRSKQTSDESVSRGKGMCLVYPEVQIITKTCPCSIEFFLVLKMKNFHRKKNDIFLIFAQNIDCGYTLEVPTIYVLEQK